MHERGVPGRKRCLHCAGELTLHEQYAGGVCSAHACRGRALQDQLIADARALQDQLIAFRSRSLGSLGEPASESIPIAIVPHYAGRVVPMDPERRHAFEQHLRDVALRAAAAGVEREGDDGDDAACVDEPADEAPARLGAAVCAACRGFCCYPGSANAAFIDEQTLNRYATQSEGADTAAIVDAYLEHIPERHFEGSCVYHGANGCTLPRRMRSATCNGYACIGLRDALSRRGDDSRRRCFVVARADHRIQRGVLIDAQGTREVRTGPPASVPSADLDA